MKKTLSNNKKISAYVLTIFFLILVSVPLYWIFKGDASAEASVVEARELVALRPATNPNLSRALQLIREGKIREGTKILVDIYMNATFVSKFERATSDQFPLRMPVIQFSKALERAIIGMSYSIVDDTAYPADMTNGIYYDAERQQLMQPVTLFNEDTRQQIDERIENYTTLAQNYPEINFYVYYHQTIHNSQYHPASKYFPEADNGQSIEYFANNLPEGVSISKFPLTSMEDHLRYYYRTDHHWTIDGILRAYGEIHTLLSQNYPTISPILEINNIVKFPEIDFLGYYARLTFYPIEGDDFAVEDVDFPSYEMLWSGQKVEKSSRQTYFEGNYSMIPYTNHFNEFYGNVTDLIEYTFENDAEKNLLIIGSSFRNALDPLLASHYKTTYCIDLRYYPDFSFSDFISNHKVDDVLVVGDNVVALQDTDYWMIRE